MSAEAHIESKIELANDPMMDLLKDCPVRPLGHSCGVYWFVSPVGQLRFMKYNEFTYNGLLSLFEGDLWWLEGNFARKGKRNKTLDGYDCDEATRFLIMACRSVGIFDSNLQIRRPGVWPSGSETSGLPRLVVHCGDVLFCEGKTETAGQKIGNAFYEATAKIERLGDLPSTPKDGRMLIETLEAWNLARGKLDAVLIAGFIGQAMLGAGPRWRAHMMTTAEAGSGKSWLAEMVKGVLGAAAHEMLNNFTEAGLRQSLTKEARCLVLDEAEHDEHGGRVRAVIELLRHMSSGEGSRTLRGSSGGQAQGFSVTGCAYLSSILHVPLNPQDRSRITHVVLNPLPENSSVEKIRDIEERVRTLRKLSPAFRRRAVERWPQFMATFEVYRSAFMQAGLSSRGGDQLATIFAGKELLLSDYPPCTDSVADDIELAKPLIEEMKDQAAEGEGQQCLNHLYSSFVDSYQGGNKRTLGQLVAEAIEVASTDANKSLGPYGIYYRRPRMDTHQPALIVIANRSVGLDRVFAGTRWGGGVWVQALGYLGCKGAGTFRFAGAVSKGLLLPQEHWPVDLKDGEV
jgi:hypothetical protein